MADKKKAALEGFLDFGAGILSAAVGDAAVNAIRGHIKTAGEEKAKDLFVDSGDRAKTLAEVAKLMISGTTISKEEAGKNVWRFILEAQKRHEEGELTSLLKKVSGDDKPFVFQMLGSLGTYEELTPYETFTATVRSFLAHDNFFQEAMKLAKRAEATGETIVGNDIRTVGKAAARGLNNAAGAILPSLRQLNTWLEEKEHGKRL